ncbi:glutathione peroxidase family protein [Lachnospiraceae bacterium KM106-2]|nr:glutathione peroxidase family protein [Lachnospiraceae bacterium KM106-2]
MSIYNYSYRGINGEDISLGRYRGKAVLIINIASKCGYTPQLEDLEAIYKKYQEQGLEIVGFPCNQFALQSPGSNQEMNEFCKRNYGVTFPLSEKIDVMGYDQHPLYRHLIEEKKFQGFDLAKSNEKLLYSIVQNEMPENVEGDSIKWNFTKFLVDKSGNVLKRFESFVEPMDMVKDIESVLAK